MTTNAPRQRAITGPLELVWRNAGTEFVTDTNPTYPVDAPGISLAGPDFTALADTLMTQEQRANPSEYIRLLYALALYSPWFQMEVAVKGTPKLVGFIPGHIWGAESADGPRSRCRVMIIGKMPGKDDLNEGRNLCGPSGVIFRNTLEQFGINVDEYCDWYVTNLLKFTNPNPNSNALANDWIKDCRPLLEQELRLVRPDYILCLGSESGKALLGLQGAVNVSQGKVFDYKFPIHASALDEPEYHTAKIMTCIHPAAVARSPDLQPQLTSAVGLFARLIQGETVDGEEKDIEHLVVKTLPELEALVDRMIAESQGTAVLAVDCEWQGEHPDEPGAYLRTIQVSHKPKFAMCVVVREKGGVDGFAGRGELEQMAFHVNRLFAPSPARKVRALGHFHRADLPWLMHAGIDIRDQFAVPADQYVGWALTKTEGGFDTGTAAHAVCETDDFKLEVLATRYVGVPRYDMKLQQWKKDYCKEHKIGADALEGYGDCPDEILYPYGCYDVDATIRLFYVYNGDGYKPGLLDCDEYGNNCRMPFWISMRAAPACLEMELTGLPVDMQQAEAMLDGYRLALAGKINELRELAKWPSFSPNSPFDCRELLFGPGYRGQIDKKTGLPKRGSPEDANLCYVMPVKATGKATKKSWEELEATGEAKNFSPGTDKESLGILFHTYKDVPHIGLLRDIRFLAQLLRTTLKPPDQVNGQDEVDDDGNRVYEKGLLSYRCSWDGRIRTHIFQNLETGRYASARPNLQNISKRREADYKRILGKDYKATLRSIFKAAPGTVLIEADYLGAELAGMAWMSGDKFMIDHVMRSMLPEDHPNYYDIHSNVAVTAFRLNCPPTKKGLEEAGKIHLRVAAKNVVFGYAYGRGAEAIARQAKEEGVTITVAEAQALIDGLVAMYPMLPHYFAACRERVADPMWTCNCFGRFRRFRGTNDRKVEGEMQRQSMNFGIQSLVADAMSRALDFLYYRRDAYGLHYKIALQIHDAVILETPIEEIEVVYDKVLPECMTSLVDIWPTDLDGFPLKEIKEPYHLGIDREVYVRWGDKVSKDECRALGIPERFGKEKKK